MLEKYAGVFDIFATTTAKIAVKENYDDYEGTYTLKSLGGVTGDLQPYGGELLKNEYGLARECQKRFFCKRDDNIKEGVYLIIDDTSFEVVYVDEWDAGYIVMLNEVDLNG